MSTQWDLLLKAKRKLEKACARFDDQIEEVAQVAKLIDDAAKVPGTADTALPAWRFSDAEMQTLREEARAGALALEIVSGVDGAAKVRVNGGAPFRVQAKPAALLSIIAAPGGRAADDHMIGWRTAAEMAAALTQRTGRATTARNVTHTLYKLRKAFRDARQNWFLIQTDRDGAVRFALRRDATLPPDGGPWGGALQPAVTPAAPAPPR
jgi:hypothetical protein